MHCKGFTEDSEGNKDLAALWYSGIPSLSSLPSIGSCLREPEKKLLQKAAKATETVLCLERNPFAIFVSFCLVCFFVSAATDGPDD